MITWYLPVPVYNHTVKVTGKFENCCRFIFDLITTWRWACLCTTLNFKICKPQCYYLKYVFEMSGPCYLPVNEKVFADLSLRFADETGSM